MKHVNKIIHRFWGGPEPIDPVYEEFGEKWKALNPDWDVILWNEETVLAEGVINKKVWDDLAIPEKGHRIDEIALATQRADVIGYELVFRFGGLYVNTDIDPVRPMADLLLQHPEMYDKPAAGYEDGQWLVNSVLWAPYSDNIFWENVIERLGTRYYEFSKNDFMNAKTGPQLLTEVWRWNPDLLYVFGVNVFNPIHWINVEPGHDAVYDFAGLPKETIGVHHWGHRKNQRAQTPSVP